MWTMPENFIYLADRHVVSDCEIVSPFSALKNSLYGSLEIKVKNPLTENAQSEL